MRIETNFEQVKSRIAYVLTNLGDAADAVIPLIEVLESEVLEAYNAEVEAKEAYVKKLEEVGKALNEAHRDVDLFMRRQEDIERRRKW